MRPPSASLRRRRQPFPAASAAFPAASVEDGPIHMPRVVGLPGRRVRGFEELGPGLESVDDLRELLNAPPAQGELEVREAGAPLHEVAGQSAAAPLQRPQRAHVPSEDSWTCPICLAWFVEPVRTPCGHSFCAACYRSHARAAAAQQQQQPQPQPLDSACPLCRARVPADSLEPDADTVADMMMATAACPNGCGAEVVPGLWHDHHNACELAPVACAQAAAGCDFAGLRRELAAHSEQCAFVPLGRFFAQYSAFVQQTTRNTRQLSMALAASERRARHRDSRDRGQLDTSNPWDVARALALLWYPGRWVAATRQPRFSLRHFVSALYLAPFLLPALAMALGKAALLDEQLEQQGWCSALLPGLCYVVAAPEVGVALLAGLAIPIALAAGPALPPPLTRANAALAAVVVAWIALSSNWATQQYCFLAMLPAVAVNRGVSAPGGASELAVPVTTGLVCGCVLQNAGGIESGIGTLVCFYALHSAMRATLTLLHRMQRVLPLPALLLRLTGRAATDVSSSLSLALTVLVEAVVIAAHVALCGADLLLACAFMQLLFLLFDLLLVLSMSLKRSVAMPPPVAGVSAAAARRQRVLAHVPLVAVRSMLVLAFTGYGYLVRYALVLP